MQSAFFKAERLLLRGPEGIVNPLPIHCFSLKQTIDKFFFIEKSWKPSSRIATFILFYSASRIA